MKRLPVPKKFKQQLLQTYKCEYCEHRQPVVELDDPPEGCEICGEPVGFVNRVPHFDDNTKKLRYMHQTCADNWFDGLEPVRCEKCHEVFWIKL